jgi:hypothetical protein
MLDFIYRPDSVRPATRQRRIIKLLLSINDIIEIKPRLFGIGVNVNKVIEKLARRFEER